MRASFIIVIGSFLALDGEGIDDGTPPAPVSLESTIRHRGVAFRFEATARVDDSFSWDWYDEVSFQVYRDGKPMLGERGSFAGCRRTSKRPMVVKLFPDAENPRGWKLVSGSICGNTSSVKTCFITFGWSERYPDDPPSLHVATIDSKQPPVLRRDGNRLQLWFTYQDWHAGGGGTARSFFVPFRYDLLPDGRLERTPLPTDYTTWPELTWCCGFQAVFVAGVHERNPALTRKALDELYAEPTDECRPSGGLPLDRAPLEEIHEALAAYVRARDRMRELGDDFGWRDRIGGLPE